MSAARNYVLTAIMISGLLAGLTTFAGSVFGQYNESVTQSQSFMEPEDVGETIGEETRQYTQSAEQDSQGIPSDIEKDTTFLGSIWTALTNIWTSISALTTGVATLGDAAGLPAWFIGMLTSMIVAGGVFAIFRFR